MSTRLCPDCGTSISGRAARCRACHRDSMDDRYPPAPAVGHQPTVLYTGSELLARVWSRGDAR